MPYRIAGGDVHKKMLAVAVADVEIEGDGDLNGVSSGPARANDGCWPSGSPSATSKKW
jgi:hypothetical protein